jgi:uroporphyrinogen decarboxylase
MGYAAFGGWEFGGDMKWPGNEFAQAPMIVRHPVETISEAANLKMPDIENAGIVPRQLEFYRNASRERLDNEPFSVRVPSSGVFTVAGNICGAERLCRWLIKEPDMAHHLLRLATDYLVDLAFYWKETFGTEGVLPSGGDPISSNQMISPRHFERFALPYLKEVHGKIMAMGFKHIYMHICGEQNLNLPFWSQVPMGSPGFVSIGHEVKLEEAAGYFPKDIIIGNLDPSLLQSGTPEAVYEASRRVIEKGKSLSAGFIFSTGCDLPPRSNIENVMAMTEAVNDFGWH